jgi:hypothetical protein
MRFTSRFAAPAALFAFVAFSAGGARAADPSTADCLGASESSIKLRGDHKLREARARLLVCAAASCPDDVRSECERHVTEVNASIPTLVFEAKDAGGNDLTAVKVTMDGAVLAERLEGTAISLDPGEHAFTFEVAGQPPVQKSFVLREGEKDRRERIVFGETALPVVATPAAAAPAPATTISPEPSGSPWKAIGLVTAGAGGRGARGGWGLRSRGRG